MINIKIMSRGTAPSGFNASKEKRKEEAKISRLVTNDLNKSAAMETIEKRIEKKSCFPTSFWQDTSK